MHIKHKVLGLVFLAMLAGALYMVNAAFTKKFTEYDEITLQTSNIGLQLPDRADVKIRGVIIGEVLEIEATDVGAQLTLGLFPSQTDTVPANVTGSIVPKTLFGEKYVSLIIPEQPAADAIKAGANIERTAVATEVEKVLSNLYPLLRAVEPADINMTLNAMATALEGRGDQLGANLETVDSYLKRLNPQIPALVEDLRLTAKVSDLYAEVLPEIGTILHNTVTTMTTLEDRADKLDALFADVSQFSGTARSFLKDNGDNLVRLGEVSRAQLRVFARYSSEFPCLLRGIVNAQPTQAETFRNFTLHIVLETLPNQPRGYGPEDVPRFGEDRGPACLHLPNPPWSQANPVTRQPNFKDNIDESTGKGTSRSAPGFGYVGSPEETALLSSLLAPGLGVSPEQVPDLGALLVGPMARGATVTLGDPADSDGVGAMKLLDKRTTGDLVKLVIFVVVTTLSTGLLVLTIGNVSFGGSRTYKAEFSDATGVVKGDDIRIAGVKVGTVKDVEISNRTRAMVTFTVADTTTVTGATHALIRYRNLVGQRYISLTQQVGSSEVLDEGDTIPVERTEPALDLTMLFNGFKPLFEALSPADLNQFSYEIIQVFQGEGGTLESLLGHTASVTQTLAARDEVIGDLIDNLNLVLDHLGDRDEQLSELILTFKTFIGGLKDDRNAILNSLEQISDLSVQTADLVKGIRQPFAEDIRQLRRFTTNVLLDKSELDRALQVMPIKLNKVGRTAIYGSFFNFYLCQFQGKIRLPGDRAAEVQHRLPEM